MRGRRTRVKVETLHWLSCPDCGAGLRVVQQLAGSEQAIVHGAARCDCRNYLVIEGILVFSRQPPLSGMSTSSLLQIDLPQAMFFLSDARDKTEQALCDAWPGSAEEHPDAANPLLAENMSRMGRVARAQTFFEAVDAWEIGDYGSFFKSRYAGATYFSALPVLACLSEIEGPRLDLGCGTGHHSRAIAGLHPGKPLFCADPSLTALYLNRRFFCPEAELIWMRGEEPWPFEKGRLGIVFMSDALDGIPNQDDCLHEMNRAAGSGSAVLVSHLHNPLGRDVWKGRAPRAAKDWQRLFADRHTRLLVDDVVLEEYLRAGKLDLARESADREVVQANAWSILSTDRPELLTVYPDLRDKVLSLQDNLDLNPLYRTTRVAEGLLLEKHWLSESMREENVVVDRFLPDRLLLCEDDVRALSAETRTEAQEARLRELMGSLVVVEVPEQLR
jgi:SAM-dependent methyltransferase